MLPVVWGWPFVGTQNFARTNKETLQNVTATLVVRGMRLAEQKCLAIIEMSDETDRNTKARCRCSDFSWDQEPGPIFAFARIWTNATALKNLQACFEELYTNLKHRRRVNDGPWNEHETLEVMMSGTPAQMERYITPWRGDVEFGKTQALPTFSGTSSGLWTNIVLSSAVALFLQWSTTGSAIMIAYK